MAEIFLLRRSIANAAYLNVSDVERLAAGMRKPTGPKGHSPPMIGLRAFNYQKLSKDRIN
jgi:hypothetical protein